MNELSENLMKACRAAFGSDEGYARFRIVENCPVCAGSSKVLGKVRSIHPGITFRLELRRCAHCGHWWINPMPLQDFLNSLYAAGSLSVTSAGWFDANAGLTIPERSVQVRESHSTSGRYLEIGIGRGMLYRHFLDRGFECTGVEIGATKDRFPNIYEKIEHLPDGCEFDVIVALDVMEHLENPLNLLKELRRRARAGARLYLSTPNVDSFQAKRWLCDWRMIRPLGHLHYFSSESLRRCLKLSGWEPFYVRKTDLYDSREFFRRWNFVKPSQWRCLGIEALGFGDQWMIEARPKEIDSSPAGDVLDG